MPIDGRAASQRRAHERPGRANSSPDAAILLISMPMSPAYLALSPNSEALRLAVALINIFDESWREIHCAAASHRAMPMRRLFPIRVYLHAHAEEAARCGLRDAIEAPAAFRWAEARFSMPMPPGASTAL